MMPEFIPVLELSGLYYCEAVRPILQADYPDLVHSAGLIGPGSEVLGFDTDRALTFGVGRIAQCVDITDILSHTGRCRMVSVLYTGLEAPAS